MEEPSEIGYLTSNNVSDTVAAEYSELCNALATFAQALPCGPRF